MNWNDLSYWRSGEWQVMQEKLDEWDKKGISYNPERQDLFSAFDATSFNDVRVCFLGQDPYPTVGFATGLAFSIPRDKKEFPPTLVNIFKEYCEDLHYPFPKHGDLSSWAHQGVLLWNVVPTCFTGRPGSHREITEWRYLTEEVIERLMDKGILWITLGSIAKEYIRDYIDLPTLSDTYELEKNTIVSYSHPSPLGYSKGKSPFQGSRLFSTINAKLIEQKKEKIDWRL